MPKEIFKTTLSKPDIDYRMAIPMDSLSAFQIQEGEYSKEFDVIDINRKVWRFRCSIRRNDPYPKPVLSSGWIKYVQDRGLKGGDEVSFNKVVDEDGVKGLRFGIQARRQVKLMGQQFWSPPL